MEPRALIFDLDGTLIDSAPGIIRCLQQAFYELDEPLPDMQTLRSCIGPPLHRALLPILGDDKAAKVVTAFRAAYGNGGMLDCMLYPGVNALLQACAQSGRELYIATSKPKHFALAILEAHGLATTFRALYAPEAPEASAASAQASTGDKTHLLRALLSTEGIAPDRCLMIGDRRFDIEAATACGVASIGVLWGYGTRDELTAAGATALAARPADVIALCL